ncbi:MAG: RidA family protein [Alphaproteobacteria bacterium]|nr:RidA family protein [Alphaproteobacteria bacterium]
MTGKVEAKLKELGIVLPAAPAPVANYVPWVRSGNLVFVAGQVSRDDKGNLIAGRLGAGMEVAAGQAAARACALALLAQVKAACGGDLDRVRRCVKLGCFVSSTDDFAQQPAVANGASDLIVAVLGDAGRHARFAVGSNVLPMNAAVEIDAVFEVV